MAFGKGSRTKSEVAEKLEKSGDTLDIAPVIEANKAAEVVLAADIKKAYAEVAEVLGTPDMPKRWGNRGKLTIASPGHIIDDPSYIPETVTCMDGTTRRICNHRVINGHIHILTKDSQQKYRWCRNDGRKLPLHQRRGFTFERWELFEGTGLFEKGPNNTVKNGDLILMKIYLDGWERMCAEKNKMQAMLEGAEGQELFQTGTSMGVPTFKDNIKTGVREFYT